MDFPLKFFILGGVGGLIPEAFRLFTLAKAGQQFRFTPFYVIMSLFFAVAAGLLAAYLPSANERAAIYAGISAPVLINTAAKRYRSRARRKAATKKQAIPGAAAKYDAPDPGPRSRFDSFVEGL